MKFGEKIKALRIEKGWIQQELADSVGLSVRTIKNYELGDSYPKKREVYRKFAEIFSVDLNYLLTEDEGLVPRSKFDEGYEEYLQMKQILDNAKEIFSSKLVNEEQKDSLMKGILDAYWESKSYKRSKK
ncbi:helix-turn-helix domain-containing protein [Peptoniphilus sp. KCTC 25270]|uniref:helix-turn-helix domain-containing protein n=1 Tax=Peptoniphilus sp. KCTC 25270 TaxID=2897414 RepID=UPI001E4CB966|nr:helix-turn-helix transcriptional regulator [Peptoniphilus sp. KCTC 25270]MCD1146886.1 helix-turn-helix domain-containing protein [Peptoniphilus sp. KCTC 25270]